MAGARFRDVNANNIGFDFEEIKLQHEIFSDKNQLNWPWMHMVLVNEDHVK